MANPLFEFDPVSEDAANSPLSLIGTANYGFHYFNVAAPPFEVQWASSVDTEGALPASVKPGNRTITFSADCLTAAALRTLQAKAAKLSRERGTAKITFPANGETLVVDILALEQFEPQFNEAWDVHTGAFCTVNMAFTIKPYGRGPEVDLGDNVETTLPVLIFTDTAVTGDVPALGRLVIDNDVAAAQQTVLWGVQSKEYSSASTAALFFEAETLSRATGALDAGPAGASGGASKTVKQTGSGFAIVEGTFTSAGEFRLFARVQAPSANTGTVTIGVRYARTGDVGSTTNATVEINPAQEGHWLIVDLGPIIVPRAPTGTHAWTLYTEETMTAGSDVLHYDWFGLVPVLEGSGRLSGNGTSAAVPSSSNATIRSDAVWIGANGGRPYLYEGDYLRVPPAGLESRTARFIVKMSRGLVYVSGATGSAYYDDSTDDLSARLYVTPRYLVAPSP